MPTNAQLSSHMQINAQLFGTRQWMQIHTDLSIRASKCRYLISFGYEQTHAEACKALDTCIHMQAFNTCMYMHSSNTCQMHKVTRSWQMQNNTCETWESQYGWRLRGQTWTKNSYLLCCTWLRSKMCWHADLQSMYLLCKSLCMAGFAQSTKHKLPLARRTCVQALKSYENLANHETTFQTHTHTHTQMQRALCLWCWISTGGIFSTFK